MTRILFVCTGNTCRSPMAEAILKNQGIPGIEVKSAGVFAINGSDASLHAKRVLEENKIVHHHESSLLTEELVNWATHILTMTSGHKAAVVADFPEASEKTFTLKEFTGGSADMDIGDPFGGPIEIYKDTYVEIEQAIKKMLGKLKNAGDTQGGSSIGKQKEI